MRSPPPRRDSPIVLQPTLFVYHSDSCSCRREGMKAPRRRPSHSCRKSEGQGWVLLIPQDREPPVVSTRARVLWVCLQPPATGSQRATHRWSAPVPMALAVVTPLGRSPCPPVFTRRSPGVPWVLAGPSYVVIGSYDLGEWTQTRRLCQDLSRLAMLVNSL